MIIKLMKLEGRATRLIVLIQLYSRLSSLIKLVKLEGNLLTYWPKQAAKVRREIEWRHQADSTDTLLESLNQACYLSVIEF